LQERRIELGYFKHLVNNIRFVQRATTAISGSKRC
jgi:hypothetical protein